MKPLTTSVSPSGHRISTPQPDPGFFRATKVGRCSDMFRICAHGATLQASYPDTIKPTHDQNLKGRFPRQACGSHPRGTEMRGLSFTGRFSKRTGGLLGYLYERT